MSQFSLICDTSLNYKIKKPIRLIELFAGIGSQAKALKNIKVDFETYKVVEIDPYVLKSYNTIHNTNFEVQDITKINPSDLCIVNTNKYEYILTYSFPCQDLSLAGKQKGMGKGGSTRSGLLWEVERLLKGCIELPQILLMENVPQVVGKANLKDFMQWTKYLNKLGYKNYFKLLNAKDYGIPQNRNRCFMVSILGNFYYQFPPKQKLGLRLKDFLEDEVDKKYYLSEKMLQFLNDETNRNGFIRKKQFRPHKIDESDIAFTITTKADSRPTDNFIEVFDFRYDEGIRGRVDNDLSPTITTKAGSKGLSSQPFIKVPQATKQGYAIAEIGDGIYTNRTESKRGVVQKESVPTIKTSPNDLAVVVDDSNRLMAVRRLTPRECFRLMGFSDSDFDKASKVNSNTQLYKQAGNSIVINVLEAIFKQLLEDNL